jgi:phage-related minor tail protein
MADRIKGITVEIGGDTLNLQKALQDVNKKISHTQSELRDVNRLLKLDPGNTELLQQKQSFLNDAIAETKEKLKQEEEALKAAAQDKNFPTDKMNALKREVIETKEKLKDLEKQADSFGSVASQQFQAAGQKLKDLGGKITDAGTTLSKSVTAPIAAVGAASLAAFNEVDAGMDIVVTKTGATGAALEDLQNSAKELALEIPTDFETAGAAVGEVNTRLGLTGQACKGLSAQFIQFAAINGTDVSTSIDQTQKILEAFNLSATDAGDVLDILNLTGQQTGISMDALESALITNAATFDELGIGIDQAAGFLGKLEMSGADSSSVMSSLTRALKNAAGDGLSLGDALANLQNQIAGASNETEGLNAAYDLFGKSGAAVYKLIKDGELDLREMTASLGGYAGSVTSTFESTLDPIDQFTLTMNQLKVTGADIGNSLMTVLAPGLEKLAQLLKDLNNWWNSLSPGMQDLIVRITLIAALAGPMLVAIGNVVTAVGSISSGIGGLLSIGSKLAGFLPGLGTVFTALTGPIGIVIAAVAGAIAIGTLLINNWDSIKAAAETVWNAISSFFNSVLSGISDTFSSIWNGILSTVTSILSSMRSSVSDIFTNIKDGIRNTVSSIADTVKTGFMHAFDYVKNLPSEALHWGSDIIHGIADGIRNAIGSVTSAVSSVASTITSWLHFSRPDVGPLRNYMTWMPDFMNGLAESINSSKDVVTDAMAALTSEMVVSPSLRSTQAMAAAGSVSGSSESISYTYGDVNINVYGAEGQSVQELAQEVESRFNRSIGQRKAVFE